MVYQKRLMIVGLFVLMFLAITYVYDIQPLIAQLAELNQIEIKANEKLLAMISQSKSVQPEVLDNQHVDKNKLDDISKFISFIHASGMMIQTSDFLSAPNNLMHLVLRGNYQQLFTLIKALEKHSDFFVLQDFSYKLTEQDDLLVTMNVFSSKQAHQEINIHDEILNKQNPFCIAENISKWIDENGVNAALSVPIERIKMIGFVSRGSHRQALVMLPNTMMRTVERGFLLGSERGVVVAINRDRMLVKLKNGRVVALIYKDK